MRLNLKYSAIFVLSLCLICTRVAQSEEFLPKQRDFERFELDNGLILIVEEDHRLPVVSVQMWHSLGSAQERGYLGSGISHLIEHMLFKGTHSRKVGKIGQEIKDLGGSLGGYTTLDRTVYTIDLPSRSAEKGLEIITDAVMVSKFDPKEFQKEREVIYKEINLTMDDPGKFIFRKLFEVAFSDHPYRFPVIGYKDRLGSLEVEEVYEYYKSAYVPNNLVLTVVGDVSANEIHKKVEEIFNDYQRGQVVSLVHVPERERIGSKEAVYEKDIAKARMIIGFIGPGIRDKDLYSIDAASLILGDGKTSRLYRRLKEDEQIVYSISAFSYTPRENGIFGISLTTEAKNIQKVKKSVWEEIDKMHSGLVTDKELARVKAGSLSSYVFGLESASGRAGSLGFNEVLVGDVGFSEKYIRGIDAVSKQDVQDAVRKYLTRENMTTVSLLPKGGIEEKAKIGQPKGTDANKIVLGNGIRVILEEDPTLPIVSVNAVFLGGQRAEQSENRGISNFMAMMLTKGTDRRTRLEIAEEIESKGGFLSSYGGNNSFGLKMKLLSKDFEEGFDVFCDVLLNPRFPDTELEKTRKDILAAIAEQEKDLFGMGKALLKKELFGDHPYSFRSLGDEETIKALSRDDLVKHYGKLVVPQNMVLAVYGDISSEDVLDMISSKVSGMKRGKFSDIAPPGPDFPKDIIYKKHALDKAQSLLLIGFPGVNMYSDERYTFEVLTTMLTGQGGRLFERVRGKEALAYAVGAYSQVGIDPGYFAFYVFTTPQDLDRSREKVFEEMRQIKKGKITQAELRMAQNELMGRDLRSRESVSSRAFEAALNELYGLGYDYQEKYESFIEAVSLEEIVRSANKYFTQDAYVECVLGKIQ